MEQLRNGGAANPSAGVPSLRPPTGDGPRQRGILMSAPMVRALLAGTKTQTRRIAKDVMSMWRHVGESRGAFQFFDHNQDAHFKRCPYGVPGDRLWVRETHARFAVGDRSGAAPQCVAYRATCNPDGSFDYVNNGDEVMNLKVTKWTPGIHMPRWASRITLEITDVRIERLCSISEEDARAEGIVEWKADSGARHYGLTVADVWEPTARGAYERIWGDINGADSWKANPWVWVVSFGRLP